MFLKNTHLTVVALSFICVFVGASVRPSHCEDKAQAQQPSTKARTPEELGKLLFEALRDGQKQQISTMVPHADDMQNAFKDISLPDEHTKKTAWEWTKRRMELLPAAFDQMYDLVNQFAADNSFEWKNSELVAVRAIEEKMKEGIAQFTKMEIRMRPMSKSDTEIVLTMGHGAQLNGAWLFTDRPLQIEITTNGKSVARNLRVLNENK